MRLADAERFKPAGEKYILFGPEPTSLPLLYPAPPLGGQDLNFGLFMANSRLNIRALAYC